MALIIIILLMFQGPEEEVQLDKITAVDCLDDDPNYPYQFMVQIAGKKSWKLKSDSEVMSTTINYNNF